MFGKVYTANSDGAVVRAFAVKDGKYEFVGDSLQASAYIGDKTKVILQSSGMVMPGCTEGHGHYFTDAAFKQLCYLQKTSFSDIVDEISTYYNSHTSISQLWGFGWYETNFAEDELMNMRSTLDAIVNDKPAFICDHEMHQGWVNTYALERAGLLEGEKGVSADSKSVPGGTVYRNPETGLATGRVQDQACGYVRQKVLQPLLDEESYFSACVEAQNTLLSMGYTNYLDAWLSYDNSDAIYKVVHDMDNAGLLNLNVEGCYEIDSYKVSDAKSYQTYVNEAVAWKTKYSSTHFSPNTVKLFADGCTESLQGYVINPYPDGTHGTRNWDPELLDEVVTYINKQGMNVHTHAYGDAAVRDVVDAYIQSAATNGTSAMANLRNGIGHAANVTDNDMERIAKNGIGVAENFCWHCYATLEGISQERIIAYMENLLGKELYTTMYPMKRFFDHDVPVSSSTDAPCSVGFPSDPFGIMEMMVTTKNPVDPDCLLPRNESDAVTISQALQAMTVNGAWQLGLDKSRGSIEVGKYADFILVDQDVLTCPSTSIHKTSVEKTFFEGREVYSKSL